MKPESLHALCLDRELGELPTETVELLDAWLAEHPESATLVASIRRTLKTTDSTIHRFPDLAWPNRRGLPLLNVRFPFVPVAAAAAVLILLGGTAWFGFRSDRRSGGATAGATHLQPGPLTTPTADAPDAGPWARYTLATHPRGGLTVVRRDTKPRS